MEEQPNNRRRNIIILGVLVVVLFVLVAFFIVRSRAPVTQNPGNNANTQITLQWWGVFLDSATVQPLLDEYNRLNPNVRIQYVNRWPGGSRDAAETQYYNGLDTILKENNPLAVPDIFMVDNTMVGYYEDYTAPAPASVLTVNELANNFYPVVVNNMVKGGQVRGLPLWVDTLAIVFNRNLLLQAGRQNVPAEWTEFKSVAQQLTTILGTNQVFGFAAGTTRNASFNTDLLQLLFVQDGVSLIDSTGRPSFGNSEDAVSTLSFLKSFSANGGSWNPSNTDNDALAFAKGRLAMLLAPSWRVNDLIAINEAQNLGLNIGVAKLPQISGSPEINWGTYWTNVVSSNRPNSVEAWRFLKWMTEPEQLRKLRTNDLARGSEFSFIYPRAAMRSELEDSGGQYMQPFLSAISTATSWYMGNGVAVRTALSELIEDQPVFNNLTDAQRAVINAWQTKLD